MKIERFVSPPPITPYAPTWDFAISEGLLPINVEKLAKTCLEKEKEIKKLPVTRVKDGKGKEVVFDGYTGVGKNSTTSKSWLYNLREETFFLAMTYYNSLNSVKRFV